jgi:hypothetical protein
LTEAECLKVLGDNAGPEIAALAKQAIEEAPAHGMYVHLLKTGAALRFEDDDSSEVFNFGSIGKDGKLQYNGLLAEECLDLKIPRSIWQSYYDALVALIPDSRRAPFPTNPELDWVADENGDDWPSAIPLLRNRKQWFKIIKDTMAQIRPLLARPSK